MVQTQKRRQESLICEAFSILIGGKLHVDQSDAAGGDDGWCLRCEKKTVTYICIVCISRMRNVCHFFYTHRPNTKCSWNPMRLLNKT
jgi:hypothetical protein